jgi:hypothetical protein
MQTHFAAMQTRPTVALADYDFLRSTYEMLLRAPTPNPGAIQAAFEALENTHKTLHQAHQQLMEKLLNEALH